MGEVHSSFHDSNPGSEATVSTRKPLMVTHSRYRSEHRTAGVWCPNTQPWKTSVFQPTSGVFPFLLYRARGTSHTTQPGQCFPSPSRFWGNISQSTELMGDRAACSEGDSVPILIAHWERFLLIVPSSLETSGLEPP